MINQIYLTEEGFKQLNDRLVYLKGEKRPEIAKKLQAARELGDLSENAEYDSAKDEQSILEAEIFEIEQKIKYGKVIDEKDIDTSKVSVGCLVKLFDEEFKEEVEYKIVGSTESDPKNNLISNESPIGKAILGKSINDKVVVQAPAGPLHFVILSITR